MTDDEKKRILETKATIYANPLHKAWQEILDAPGEISDEQCKASLFIALTILTQSAAWMDLTDERLLDMVKDAYTRSKRIRDEILEKAKPS